MIKESHQIHPSPAMRWAEDVEEHDDRAQRREVDVDNIRNNSALNDETLENMESALKEALTAVSEGRLNIDVH
ncbi:hypothetical protein IBA8401_43570 [Pseudomonas syringae]